MNHIQQLRESVELPAGYSSDAPVAERKRILYGAVAEHLLSKAMMHRVIKKKDSTSVVRRRLTGLGETSFRVNVARYIEKFGPITANEITLAFPCDVNVIRSQISILKKRGHIKRLSKKRKIDGRPLSLYTITETGKSYGVKK